MMMTKYQCRQFAEYNHSEAPRRSGSLWRLFGVAFGWGIAIALMLELML